MDDTNIKLDDLMLNSKKEVDMPNDKKISIIKWIEFGLTCLTIIGKVVKEIIQNLPDKN